MRVELSSYYIDRYEVTWEQWRACVKAGKCPNIRPRYGGFDGPKQPVSGADWYQAKTFCEASGKRLPTEAEWEMAARGPDGEINPWGNAPANCDRAVIMDERGRACGIPKPGSGPEVGHLQPVGTKPAGRYGLFDMSGNIQEWVSDWYTPDWKRCGAACEGKDPKGPCDGQEPCAGYSKRVLRGGSWYWPAAHATGLHRRANEPSFKRGFHHFGFRCAASVEQAGELSKQRPW
jgi:formylglycine-generating enzyme required for sulfatase activity